MQVLPQCGHAVHEDAPEKARERLPQLDKKKQKAFNLPD